MLLKSDVLAVYRCGCNQILTACNHAGCTTTTAMLKKLAQVVARAAKMGGLAKGILPVKSLAHPIGADLSLTETVCF